MPVKLKNGNEALDPQLQRFWKELEHRMVDLDMNQRMLAERAGVDEATISKLLNRQLGRDVRLSTLSAIARSVRCEIRITPQRITLHEFDGKAKV